MTTLTAAQQSTNTSSDSYVNRCKALERKMKYFYKKWIRENTDFSPVLNIEHLKNVVEDVVDYGIDAQVIVDIENEPGSLLDYLIFASSIHIKDFYIRRILINELHFYEQFSNNKQLGRKLFEMWFKIIYDFDFDVDSGDIKDYIEYIREAYEITVEHDPDYIKHPCDTLFNWFYTEVEHKRFMYDNFEKTDLFKHQRDVVIAYLLED